MNIVFWLIVILALVLVWFTAYSIFGDIGEVILDMFNKAKNEIMNDESENENE